MSLINISNLTFAYEGSYDNIFFDVSFQIDTDWKLGFCGRNGRGKTTFLKLLMGGYDYTGTISSSVKFDYFPFEVKDKSKTALEIAEDFAPNFEQWVLNKELNALEVSDDCLYRPFSTLSGGEQTKILLAVLFLKEGNFLLIDEPTNHLDANARGVVSRFLNTKKSFILVSHDRSFLDGCVDHILSINRTDIEVQSGNFSSWLKNKENRDNFEIAKNKKLESEIDRLKAAAEQKNNWAASAEKKKKGAADKGFMGHKAAKQMKTAKIIERRQDKTIEDKTNLLKNIETARELFLTPIIHSGDYLIDAKNLKLYYNQKQVLQGLDFTIKNGDRVLLKGKNGSGKSSLLKLIAGQKIDYSGSFNIASRLKISYVPQDTSGLSGNLKEFIRDNDVDETLFKALLNKMDFSKTQFDKDMSGFSAGQKKKIFIAKSLCESAHLYVWDEPLNYIDIISRMQIENLILDCSPTLLFVEHDSAFADNIATEIIDLQRL